jgi:hypothetical protein
MGALKSWNLRVSVRVPDVTSYDGPAILSFYRHALLPYYSRRLAAGWSLCGITELYVHDPRLYGEDWQSPLIRQVYRELGGRLRDPFEDPTAWRETELRLRVMMLDTRKCYDCIVELVDFTVPRYTGGPDNYFLFHGRPLGPVHIDGAPPERTTP